MKKINKSSNAALIAELDAKLAQTASKSAVAQSTQNNSTTKTEEKKSATKSTTAQAVKLRENMIVFKTQAELAEDKRAVIKQHRAYMIDDIAEDSFKVYNATMYTDSNNVQHALTQKIADKLVDDFIQTVTVNNKFTAREISILHQTCGGAYRDKLRKRLFEVSQLLTQTQAENLSADMKKSLKDKNKLCIFYNILEDSRRTKYEFVRVF
jgi:hypothetical protein